MWINIAHPHESADFDFAFHDVFFFYFAQDGTLDGNPTLTPEQSDASEVEDYRHL